MLFVPLLLSLPILEGPPHNEPPKYAIVALCPEDTTPCFAGGLNESGFVVGSARFAHQERHGFLWQPNPGNRITDLNPEGGTDSRAAAINLSGTIVGEWETKKRDPFDRPIRHAALWSAPEYAMTDLGALPGEGGSSARSINDAGHVSGSSEIVLDWVYVAFLWLPQAAFGLGQGMHSVPTSDASDMNQASEIVGMTGGDVVDFWRGQIWLPRPAHGLPAGVHVLPGLEDTTNVAYGINDAGQVVGWAGLFEERPFLWDNGSVTYLALPPDFSGSATDINNRGEVLGRISGGRPYTTKSVLWIGGEVFELGRLVVSGPSFDPMYARAINDRGQIVGYGTLDGKDQAFLMSPIDADMDDDKDVDLADFRIIQDCCFLGPEEPCNADCAVLGDLDRDGDFDLGDIQAIQNAFTGF